MSFSQIFHFSLRLISQKKGRSLLTFFSIALGVMMMFLSLSFSAGIKNFLLAPILEKSSPEMLLIRKKEPQSGVLKSIDLLTKGSKLTQKEVETIQNTQHIENVGKKMMLEFPSSLNISLFGVGFNTDVPIFGVDAPLTDLPSEKFLITEDGSIPVVLSPRLLDLFNASFADAIPGIGKLQEKDLLGRKFTILFGKSSFFSSGFRTQKPVEIPGYLAGFSEKVPEVGIAIPLEEGIRLTEIFLEKKPEDIHFYEILAEVDEVKNISAVQSDLEAKKFEVKSYEELGEEIRTAVFLITVLLFSTGIIILLLAFFSLFSLVTVSVLQQQKNIGILRALGTSKKIIFSLFLVESGILSLFGSVLGIFLGILFSRWGNMYLTSSLPQLSFSPENFFPISLGMIFLLLGIVLFSVFFSSFFPAFSAAKKDPLKAIWG